MDKIGIIVAMSAEFRLVEALLEHKREKEIQGFRFIEGERAGKQVVMMQCGIGKVCAAVGTVEMIRNFQPEAVINTGVAGGIDTGLQVMDIVLGKEVVYHDVWCGTGNEYGQVQGMPARYKADERLLEAARGLGTKATLHEGLICCGDQFITDRKALQQIKDRFPEGIAVDMESGAVAQVCYLYGIPFLSCRIISDTPGAVEDHALQYRDFWTLAPEQSFRMLQQILREIE